MFEMPSLVKPIPNNQWVWELQDRIERAHATVRQYTQQSMRRQKQIHDSRTAYEQFNTGDQVFVYFPIRQTGTSSKLTPFWRGPFSIVGKLSNVLYKVNCGRNGTVQVIHCNRIRSCKQQILRNETELLQDGASNAVDDNVHDQVDRNGNTLRNDDEPESQSPMLIEPEVLSENDDEQSAFSGRKRKKPVWAKDYVFYCRSAMAKTKTTPRSQTAGQATPRPICPVCHEAIAAHEKFETHLV